MKNTMVYTAGNGVKLYIVGIEAFNTDTGPMMSITYTRDENAVDDAIMEHDYDSECVPMDCADMLANSLNEIRETFELESYEEPHVGYVVIKEADTE